MKYLIIIISLFFNFSVYAEIKISDVKEALKEDDVGKLKIENNFHNRNARHATNPISISNFSIIGDKSIRFEQNHGECSPKDCKRESERVELIYEEIKWKTERWYRFYIYIPKESSLLAPASMTIMQWKRLLPNKDAKRVLIMFRHHFPGLVFNFNGDNFPDSYIVLKKNEDLIGNWTEIIFNTNWHPDPKKGFAKVWIDGHLKVDFKGRMNDKKHGKVINLRHGLYIGNLDKYREAFNKKKHPQRIIFFDGIKREKSCMKLINNKNKCKELLSQSIDLHEFFDYVQTDKKLTGDRITKASIKKLEDYYNNNFTGYFFPKNKNKNFTQEEIDFLMTAKGDDEKCIRDQFFSGLDLLRKDTIFHERYFRWEVYSVLKEIVKDCLN